MEAGHQKPPSDAVKGLPELSGLVFGKTVRLVNAEGQLDPAEAVKTAQELASRYGEGVRPDARTEGVIKFFVDEDAHEQAGSAEAAQIEAQLRDLHQPPPAA